MRPYGAILADNIANGNNKIKEEQPVTKTAQPAEPARIEPASITNFRQNILRQGENGLTNN